MNLSFLENIRSIELQKTLKEIEKLSSLKFKILEIGAGSGWQAKVLADQGHEVYAIDIKNSTYSKNRVWPILDYDGSNIPFEDGSFDIVFSSNVLEHIPHVTQFQEEIKRVLKKDGLAIHILPSSSCRFWTNVTHVITMFKILVSILRGNKSTSLLKDESHHYEKIKSMSVLMKVKKFLMPVRHGEIGNAFTELFYFSSFRWKNLFEKTGWVLLKTFPNNVFYTGYMLLGPKLAVKYRFSLSKILGSSCNVFILKKK